MNANIDFDKIGEVLKNTLGLMKTAVAGLTERNSTIYNLLYTSDNMQRQNEGYNELLTHQIKAHKHTIIKWAIIIIGLYVAFMVFSYIFVNYVLYYVVIFALCFGLFKFIHVYFFNINNNVPLLQNSEACMDEPPI